MALAKTSSLNLSAFDPRTDEGRQAIVETAQIVDIFRNGFPRSTDADTIAPTPQSSPNPTTKQGDTLIEKGKPNASVLNTLGSQFSDPVKAGVLIVGIGAVAYMVFK